MALSSAFAAEFVVTPDATKMYYIDGKKLSMVDVATGQTKLIEQTPTYDYSSIVMAPNGKKLYVSRKEFNGRFVGIVDAFDTATNKPTNRFTFDYGESVQIDLAGNAENYKVVVKYLDESGISFIDGITNEVIKVFPSDRFLQFGAMAFTLDGNLGYIMTGAGGAANLSILNLSSPKPSLQVDAIRVTYGTSLIVDNQKNVYISSGMRNYGQISQVDTTTKREKLFMYTGSPTKLVYVTRPGDNNIPVEEIYINGKAATTSPVNANGENIVTAVLAGTTTPLYIKVTHSIDNIMATFDGSKVFVGNLGIMSVIDTKTHQVTRTFQIK